MSNSKSDLPLWVTASMAPMAIFGALVAGFNTLQVLTDDSASKPKIEYNSKAGVLTEKDAEELTAIVFSEMTLKETKVEPGKGLICERINTYGTFFLYPYSDETKYCRPILDTDIDGLKAKFKQAGVKQVPSIRYVGTQINLGAVTNTSVPSNANL
jgi:hypothetical protein